MDGSTFDRLTRAVITASSRRHLLGALASVGLGGLLTSLEEEATEAKRKRHGRRRSHRPGKHKDNRKGKRKGGKGGGGVGGPGSCTANGRSCQQNNDCCSENCFGQVCAATVTQCGSVDCPPGSTGCCEGNCCASPANQCNAVGECCAPNCGGRECGPDGCGGAGTCGACESGESCNAATGQCSAPPTCTAENCPAGCCSNGPGNPGTCQPGNLVQGCGTGGEHCAHCANTQTCQDKQCVACTQRDCFCAGQSACLNPEAPNVICSANPFCYCAVTTAGVPVCASGATGMQGGCQTDQDCVDVVNSTYCLNAANNLDPQNPCFFGESFCADACPS